MNKIWLLTLAFPGVASFITLLTIQDLSSPSTYIIPFVVITILIAVNGLFVAAEFAINAVRPTQMAELVESGNKTAVHILAILESPAKQDTYIATAQLGITIASLGLGMYGEPQIAHLLEAALHELGVTVESTLLHTVSSIIALSLLTYLHVVVGEMVPKSIALATASKAVLGIYHPMQFSEFIFNIPVRFLNNIGNLALRLFKIPLGQTHLHSTEELEQIIAESAEEGLLNEEEGEFILNIFTFSDREAHQVMTPRRKIEAIASDIDLPKLIEIVTKSPYSRFPIYEGDLDHVIGILHIKDLVRQQLRSKGSFDLRLLMHPVPSVPEHFPVEKLLTILKRQRLHMAIILDEYGGTVGIVTLEDMLEEVVGEVRDEFDREQERFIELEPGSVEVSGQYLIDELTDHVSLGKDDDLPDVETVGGLIITLLGRPPQVGDEVIYSEQIKFTVLAIDRLAIVRAKVDFPVILSEDEETQKDSEQ